MRTKRILAFVLCALMLAAFIPTAPQTAYAATSDDTCDSSPDGKHHWEHYDYADCTSGGSSFDQCKYCYEMRNEVWVDALGHNWGEWITRKEVTCTSDGTRYHQCTRCHEGESETIPALGHAWDNGKETKAATCTEAGVKTFTCLRDSSHTRTESIPALGHSYRDGVCTRCGAADPSVTPTPTAVPVTPTPTAVPVTPTPKPTAAPTAVPATPAPAPVAAPFSGMDIPSGFGFLRTGDPISDILRIVTQPQGGYVPQGGYTELTVEAAGGEGEYTYEWWYAPELPMVGTSALTDFLTGFYGDTVATVTQAKEKTSPIAAEFLEAWKKQNGIPGTVDHSVKVTEGTIASTETETLQMEVFNPLAEKLSTSPEPGCNAWKSGTYWCVVYDEAGHHATSNKVQMKDGLYIAVQPESKNLYGLSSVTLTCRAGGGSGHYAYTWYDGNLNVVEDQQTYVAEQMGVYYCEVADYDTLEVVKSQSALAYYAERDLRPTITLQPESMMLEYREDGQYSWSLTCLAQAFDGDTENLQYQWSGKTDSGWAPIGASETLSRSYDHGTFRCTITDKRNGQYVSSDEAKVALIMASEQPTVTPAFGVLAWNQHFDFNFPFKGGVGPYQVDVYQVSYNNVPGIEPVVTHYNSYVTDSGDNIVIYDAPYVHFVFIEQNGEEKKYEDYYKYYVTVTDASGQEQTSESVWYWDAETTR